MRIRCDLSLRAEGEESPREAQVLQSESIQGNATTPSPKAREIPG